MNVCISAFQAEPPRFNGAAACMGTVLFLSICDAGVGPCHASVQSKLQVGKQINSANRLRRMCKQATQASSFASLQAKQARLKQVSAESFVAKQDASSGEQATDFTSLFLFACIRCTYIHGCG